MTENLRAIKSNVSSVIIMLAAKTFSFIGLHVFNDIHIFALVMFAVNQMLISYLSLI